MSRPLNAEMPTIILAAAERLWREGRDASMTLRRTAEAAGTTTPTIYNYFSDRRAIMIALRRQAIRRFNDYMSKSQGFASACEHYVAFGESHPSDYELLYGAGWRERSDDTERDEESRKFARLLRNEGVADDEASKLGLAVTMMLHGALMHRLSSPEPGHLWRRVRGSCLETCVAMLRSAQKS